MKITAIHIHLDRIRHLEKRHYLRVHNSGISRIELDLDPNARLNTTRGCKMVFETDSKTGDLRGFYHVSDTHPATNFRVHIPEGAITFDVIWANYREFRCAAEGYWCGASCPVHITDRHR